MLVDHAGRTIGGQYMAAMLQSTPSGRLAHGIKHQSTAFNYLASRIILRTLQHIQGSMPPAKRAWVKIIGSLKLHR